MESTFFAIRPMFSATERLALSKSAYDNSIAVVFLPRRNNPFRSLGFYNIFTLATQLSQYEALRKFAELHSFLLVGCFLGGYMTTLQFSRSVASFSLLGFYPSGLCRLSFLFPLLVVIKLLFPFFRLKNTTCLPSIN